MESQLVIYKQTKTEYSLNKTQFYQIYTDNKWIHIYM